MKCPYCKTQSKYVVEFDYNKAKSYFVCKNNCYQKFLEAIEA